MSDLNLEELKARKAPFGDPAWFVTLTFAERDALVAEIARLREAVRDQRLRLSAVRALATDTTE